MRETNGLRDVFSMQLCTLKGMLIQQGGHILAKTTNMNNYYINHHKQVLSYLQKK